MQFLHPQFVSYHVCELRQYHGLITYNGSSTRKAAHNTQLSAKTGNKSVNKMPVSKDTTMLEVTASQLIDLITQTTVHTRHGIFPITPQPIDKVWNILNRVSEVEMIPMIFQIEAFEKWLKDNNHV